MKDIELVLVGENIHCTRIFKVGGKYVHSDSEGSYYIEYADGDEKRQLNIPEPFMKSADWENKKVKHCAVAIWQGNYGSGEDKSEGLRYIQALAKKQEQNHAHYLDINVDEFSTDIDERISLMKWTVDAVQQAVTIPVSVDSSNISILKAGLETADTARNKPMVNSVSLERYEAIDVAAQYNAVVIASAAGEKDLPSDVNGRLQNLDKLMPMLKNKGYKDDDIHVDPLVFPISTDNTNGKTFLNSVSSIREKYGEAIHIVAGLSNVSFGMPKRMLLNQVFSYLAIQAGADGGIVDPAQINAGTLDSINTDRESFKITADLLLGKDDFGMNYITACREGRI